MSELADQDVASAYEAAVAYVGSSGSGFVPSDDVRLQFYGLFKQATVGDVNTAQPAFWDMVGYAKWNAWQGQKGKDKHTVMREYVELVQKHDPSWQPKSSENTEDSAQTEEKKATVAPVKKASSGEPIGPVFSVPLSQALDDEAEETKDICYYTSAGETEKVIELLDSGVDVNFEDAMGMSALHWACDRGHLDMARLLLDRGAQVNAEDECGTTPLHVACTCDHADIVELLLARGADPTMTDGDGERALDFAESAEVRELLTRTPVSALATESPASPAIGSSQQPVLSSAVAVTSPAAAPLDAADTSLSFEQNPLFTGK